MVLLQRKLKNSNSNPVEARSVGGITMPRKIFSGSINVLAHSPFDCRITSDKEARVRRAVPVNLWCQGKGNT
jgi:hypothetical protein